MTEHEYNRMCEKQQAQLEHRREVCRGCDHNVCTPDNEDERWCGCPNDTGFCYELSDLMVAETGFCDAWGEDSDNAPTLTPKADEELFKRMHKAYKEAKEAEVARNVAKVKGFCVKDINAYIDSVDTFCDRLTQLLDITQGRLSVGDVDALKQGAGALVEMSKNGGCCE